MHDESRTPAHQVSETEPSSAQLVSQVAQDAQKRLEETQKEVQRSHPSFVLDVEQSEVGYTLRPGVLPIEHVDYEILSALLAEKWGLAPDLTGITLDPATLQKLSKSDDFDRDMVIHVLKSRDPRLTFTSGRYRVSDFEFVPIRSVTMTFESILVSVAGIDRVAEAVAQETFEAMAASAGAAQSWTSVEDEVQLVGYATRTRIALGSAWAFERMLSPAVLKFLDDEVAGGSGYGSHAGSYHARHELGRPPKAYVTVALDDAIVFISRFDTETGMSTQSKLRFSVTARGDYRSGVVSVSSELPYQVHVECLGKLIDCLDRTPQSD